MYIYMLYRLNAIDFLSQLDKKLMFHNYSIDLFAQNLYQPSQAQWRQSWGRKKR